MEGCQRRVACKQRLFSVPSTHQKCRHNAQDSDATQEKLPSGRPRRWNARCARRRRIVFAPRFRLCNFRGRLPGCLRVVCVLRGRRRKPDFPAFAAADTSSRCLQRLRARRKYEPCLTIRTGQQHLEQINRIEHQKLCIARTQVLRIQRAHDVVFWLPLQDSTSGSRTARGNFIDTFL